MNGCSIPYDTVLKYELTREKVFKQIGLPLTSSKLWRLQNEPNRRGVTKTKTVQHDIPTHEYIESLAQSHETTLKYAKLLQSFLDSYEKHSQNLSLLLDTSSPLLQPKQVNLQELEQIYYKDLSKFKEISSKELQMLEFCSKNFFQIEKNVHLTVLNLEEKFVLYEKNLKNLEGHIDTIVYKHKVERDECQIRLQELLETCHDYSEQIEQLRAQKQEIFTPDKKLHYKKNSVDFEKNNQLVEIISKLECQVNELNKDIVGRDKRIEKLTETLRMMENRNVDLRKELGVGEKVLREKFKEEFFQLESQTSELRDLLEQKDKELESSSEKLKFLQDELSSYKFHKDQELKQKHSDAKEIQELRAKNNELKEEVLRYKTQCLEFKQENSELLNQVSDENGLKRNFAQLQDSVHKIIEKFARSEESEVSEDSSRVLNEIEYVGQLVNKLANDNDWLVDRLADLGQENHRLMQELSPSKLRDEDIAELKATSNAFKEFENSRSKIFYKF